MNGWGHRRPLIIAAAAACLLTVVGIVFVAVHAGSSSGGPGLTSSYPTPSTAGHPTTSRSPAPSAALAKLAAIPIKGRAPKTGYDRALFGTAWTDDVTVPGGHNGCDTRDDMLARDLTGVGYKPGRKTCVVLSGTLTDPYTGEVILFSRGPRSNQVQVDHIVPILDAWQKALSSGTTASAATSPTTR